MKIRLFLLLLLAAVWPSASDAATAVVGVVVNGNNGSPLSGVTVALRDAGLRTSTNFNGQFRLEANGTGEDYLTVIADGYEAYGQDVTIAGASVNLGEIRLTPYDFGTEFYGDSEDLLFDEALMESEEDAAQGVSALTGANNNIYYNTASYNFQPMYFRFRGMDNQYQSVYLNGIRMNDLIRGSFTFNNLLGMTSRAFRNKTTTIGLDASNYGFGDLAGSVNYNTTTDLYAPGFNGSLAFTNSNYMLRAMATYSSGVNKQGWAFTFSAIGRYAKEGVMPGTFYNSAGLFMSIEKIFNKEHSLTLTAFGGPTQRATGRATVQEAYDLAGSNLYNPDWGYQDGKKRSARITETFDPTVMLNWLFKNDNVTLNTAAGFRSMYYNRTALQYYKATDPNPSYYRYLPSYFEGRGNQEAADLYRNLWLTDESFRQIKWDDLYQINYLNNIQNENLPVEDHKGSSYIMENRINHQVNAMLSSYINTRLTDVVSLQGGASFNYTKSSNYKTVRDLMGGQFWLDIDPFSDRVISLSPEQMQNDLDNPNRRVVKGDRFGYDYDIHVIRADAWLQNVITLPQWDINYGLQMSYTQFYRDGKMRNGRAPRNSLGKSKTMQFDNAMLKVGALYKLDGRNQFALHAEYGTRAPLFDNVFISPRVKNTIANGVGSETDFSADISYIWNYRRFMGSISAFFTQVDHATERTGFYDDDYQTYVNYVITDIKRHYKGIELGMAYKITPSVTATFAGQYSRFQYKNNPDGTRSFENGLYADTTRTVYLKNYYLGSTPQYAANLGIDWAAPSNWFFNINATVQGDAYVNLAPAYHQELAGLVEKFPNYSTAQLEAKIAELSTQEKLKDSFTLNASIGKAIYLKNNMSININLNVNNILNRKDIATYAYQQGRLDTSNFDRNKYPTRYQYAQGIRFYLNLGIRF